VASNVLQDSHQCLQQSGHHLTTLMEVLKQLDQRFQRDNKTSESPVYLEDRVGWALSDQKLPNFKKHMPLRSKTRIPSSTNLSCKSSLAKACTLLCSSAKSRMNRVTQTQMDLTRKQLLLLKFAEVTIRRFSTSTKPNLILSLYSTIRTLSKLNASSKMTFATNVTAWWLT
jgi:hypothetical protein